MAWHPKRFCFLANAPVRHCISAYEGDIIVAGSDGVFDNMFMDEIAALCDTMLPPSMPGHKFRPVEGQLLGEIARTIVCLSDLFTMQCGVLRLFLDRLHCALRVMNYLTDSLGSRRCDS